MPTHLPPARSTFVAPVEPLPTERTSFPLLRRIRM